MFPLGEKSEGDTASHQRNPRRAPPLIATPGLGEALSSLPPESVSSLLRNHCPVSAGFSVQFPPESLSALVRNTHSSFTLLGGGGNFGGKTDAGKKYPLAELELRERVGGPD